MQSLNSQDKVIFLNRSDTENFLNFESGRTKTVDRLLATDEIFCLFTRQWRLLARWIFWQAYLLILFLFVNWFSQYWTHYYNNLNGHSFVKNFLIFVWHSWCRKSALIWAPKPLWKSHLPTADNLKHTYLINIGIQNLLGVPHSSINVSAEIYMEKIELIYSKNRTQNSLPKVHIPT